MGPRSFKGYRGFYLPFQLGSFIWTSNLAILRQVFTSILQFLSGHKASPAPCNFKFYVLLYQREEQTEVLCCGVFAKYTPRHLNLNSLNTEIVFQSRSSIQQKISNAKYFYNYLNVLLWCFLVTTKFFLVSELKLVCNFVGSSNLKTSSWALDIVYNKYWMKYGQSLDS